MSPSDLRPLTLCTAGHIDHGKTWLVRALTGHDTDRLPEEKRRGISIELGFAPLILPRGRQLSLIDVPGHERFVRTMIAGASGIDLYLLVVDAREGPRAQTHEHLAILRLLGIERGVIAITKIDAVGSATAEATSNAMRGLVSAEVAVVPVSAKTGEGIPALLDVLEAITGAVARSAGSGPTRLHIDRVFSLPGAGTVATGTLLSGTMGRGDVLEVLPAGYEVRVRSVEVHDRAVECAEAGQRVAVALVTPRRRERPGRGDVLAEPGAYRPSFRANVALDELAPVRDGARLIACHGTLSARCRLIRLEEREAQLRFDQPIVAKRGDHIVLRDGTTVGGGIVLDPSPPRLSRRIVQASEELGGKAERRPQRPRATRPSAKSDLDPQLHELTQRLVLRPLEPMLVADRDLTNELVRLVARRLPRGFVVHRTGYERARDVLIQECALRGTITLACFRDLLGTSRRTAQLLLEQFDIERTTIRVGDARRLRRARQR